jgi:hypothetical protein
MRKSGKPDLRWDERRNKDCLAIHRDGNCVAHDHEANIAIDRIGRRAETAFSQLFEHRKIGIIAPSRDRDGSVKY